MLKIELPEPRLTEELTWRNKPILRRPRKPRPKRRKRKPAGRIRLSKFGDTPVGRIIRAECPHEWDLLASLSVKITPEMIERISYSSGNPGFRTERFRLALQDYWQYGCKTPNAVTSTVEDELDMIRKRLTGYRSLD